MNMLEALAIAQANMSEYVLLRNFGERISFSNRSVWARPVSWRGLKVAYTWRVGTEYQSRGWEMVPGSRGGYAAFLPTDEIFEEWEIVSPEQVNAGE